MYKILIVEDDPTISCAMKKHIEKWGYEIYIAENYQNILKDFTDFNPDLVLLDITLPFYNGYHWCSEIRRLSKVPIIFVSSAADNMNIVMAMNMGGDDFISKPFDLNVLTAKITALLRRTYDFSAKTAIVEHNGAILNIGEATLNYRGQKVELTKNEYKIIQILIENKSNIVSREMIMERLWESDSFVDENTLTVNVTRLRKKLELVGLKDYIITKKGLGYIV